MPIPEMPASSRNPLRGAVEIIPNRLYYCALNDKDSLQNQKIMIRNPHVPSSDPDQKVPVVCFQIDNELVYWNFFLDFGPLNLGQLWRFTDKLNKHLARAEKDGTTILFYSSTHDSKRANAIFLICAWQVMELRRTPEEAMSGFSGLAHHHHHQHCPHHNREARTDASASARTSTNDASQNRRSNPPLLPLSAIGEQTIDRLPPFHDASPFKCSYHLTLADCLAALVKARQFEFFDWGDRFDIKEYEYYEQVEKGDLNWIIKGKIMAFAGPSFVKTLSPEGYCTLSPNDYIPYFKRKNIGLVVRLNQRNYDETQFINSGMDHFEEVYTDGSCPSMAILRRVVAAFERVPHHKGFAVHCKAGLGRTGTCIGAYMMKHYRMTAKEVIGWMRICRPGMVIGPQQEFLDHIQAIMWQEGDLMRSKSEQLPSPLPSLAPRHKHIAKVHPSSPSEHSTSTATTVPESPSSVVLATANSHEVGHEVILGGSAAGCEYLSKEQLETAFDREKREGRPGQADGLLAARQNHNRTQVPPQSPTPTNQSSSNDGDVAMPVTPDARTAPATSSSAMWAWAFA